jgi:hypothetical protein
LAAEHRNEPLVCFVSDVARMIGVSNARVEAHLREHSFPIEQIAFYGLLRRSRFPLRGHDHEARPAWFKGRVLEFLEKPDWEQARLLELRSEIVARTCTHCPVHCPTSYEHSYSRYLRSPWRRRQW